MAFSIIVNNIGRISFFILLALSLGAGLWASEKMINGRSLQSMETDCLTGKSAICLEIGLEQKDIQYLESGCRQEYLPACYHLARFLMLDPARSKEGLEIFRQNCHRHDLLSCHRLNAQFQKPRYEFCSHLELNNCRDILTEAARMHGTEASTLIEMHCLAGLREGCHYLGELTKNARHFGLACELGNKASCKALEK